MVSSQPLRKIWCVGYRRGGQERRVRREMGHPSLVCFRGRRCGFVSSCLGTEVMASGVCRVSAFICSIPGPCKAILLHVCRSRPDLGFGSYQAKEMLDHLESVLANEPVAVKSGQFIVEVKPQVCHSLTFSLEADLLELMDDDKSKKNEQKNHNPKESTEKSLASTTATFEGIDMVVRNNSSIDKRASKKRGMVLPFQPLSLAFNHVNYYVNMPEVRNILRVVCTDTVILNLLLIIRLYACHEMKSQGIKESRLQLMDVLAGRKIGGYTNGSIIISGYPKNQSTFARISGYCEQNDIHSPHVLCL
ncbi:hypothetical protein H5410_001638 [Solanum commersonii]|uniref:Uncharacterized protein n=1 Tax=Solanum commersonii TaxID=4109 RepID=A0A9J6AZR2_SOLCO|nr:hypothetical protein H5410_001638 [Solanum commersonii]